MTIELTPQILRDSSTYIASLVHGYFDNPDEQKYSCHSVGRFMERSLGLASIDGTDAYGRLLVDIGAMDRSDDVLEFGAVSHATQQEIRYMLMLFLAHYLEDEEERQ